MKKRTFFWLFSLLFVGFIVWTIYDIMNRTTAPWERKKQREAQEKAKKLEKAVPKVQLKKDSVK